ncbi:hypothetical protein ISF_01412 [Cordyceps fumosorosea ARSEF 2679]|uniref:Uncharacterized protein n=1 Tax=Cordyceps fumosorosea (strain ARSEF 2679) TaxID=1081104 RepID=A0A162MXT1_CORFA|nr:hypothetical protein ISF_01412 [Cordyceps fumosorosea ARSEF 2679]OAA72339.1 hypothetical protein ISF_01412 [Cordyceps fumosorosea ARSEF 2679]
MNLITIFASVAVLAAALAQAKPGPVEANPIFPTIEMCQRKPIFSLVFSLWGARNISAHLDTFTIGLTPHRCEAIPVAFNTDQGSDHLPVLTSYAYGRGQLTTPPGDQDAAQYLWDSVYWPRPTRPGGGWNGYLFTTTAQSGREVHERYLYYLWVDGPLPEDPCRAEISGDEARKIVETARSKAFLADKSVVSCSCPECGAGVVEANDLFLFAWFAALLLLLLLFAA